MCKVHPRADSGFTFAELAFALLILVIGAAVLVNHLAVNYQTTAAERDRVFAYSKAQAMLSEIQSYVDRAEVDAAVDLDTLDDGVVTRSTLTIQRDSGGSLVPADHVVSGNFTRGGQWVWSRRITVQPFAGVDSRNMRYVTVRVFKRDRDGVERAMADLSAVVNSSGAAFPTTQVFDLYLLAIENVPGWWVFMDSMKPFIESMLTDLETRNPGLSFRTHWITKAAFGRNQLYRPYTNDTADSLAVIPDVYHYPGRMPDGSASAYYYVPDNMRARINVEGTERNGYDADLNPHPYAFADFFNHAMRYPDELALWQARVAAIEAREQEIADAIAAGTTPPPVLEDMSKEPTLRLFLEDLYSQPAKYRNALLINLHGELLPMPALRNFSDAARSPAVHPNLRVVTHPEELRTRRNDAGVTDSLQLRMYAYGHRTGTTAYAGPATMVDPMVVEIVGVDLTDDTDNTRLAATCTLQNIPGGVPVGGSSNYATSWQAAKHVGDGPLAGEMHYRAEWVAPSGGVAGFTRIYLYNTPVGAPAVTQSGQTYGLANSTRARLYQLEYVPCPIDAGPAFNTDLADPGVGPKNTARWTLRISPNVLTDGSFVDNSGTAYNPTGDVQLQIRTRIATGASTGGTAWQQSGTVWPTPDDPENLSVTYAWWADSREDVPFTERVQFNGDPRHLPYRDCFNNGDDFPNSYNWYHDSLANGTSAVPDFPSMNGALLRNGWNSAMNCDVPRYFQLLREGLVRSACVYTSMTGWSYYYLGIGNDIGYDSANGYPNSIPSNLQPHGGAGNGFIQTILTGGTSGRRYLRAAGANFWWGLPWLGELYPDSVATSQWLASSGGVPRGNLTAGTAAGSFYQDRGNAVYAAGNRLAQGTSFVDHGQRTSSFGCTTFFNIGTSASTFQHSSSTANGSLTAVGNELANNYNMTMPSSAPVSRPFRINAATTVAAHWNQAPYTSRNAATLFHQYYSHASGSGSALIKLTDPGATSAAYIVVNGISNAVDNGTTFIAKYALLSLVHSFFEAGSTSNTLRIPQQPRLEIESPTDITELLDPATIPIQLGVDWRRWDGLNYSATGTFAEDELQLEYVIMYSRDGGTTWLHVQDDSPATPGQRPSDPAYLVADTGAGSDVYDWDVPAADFPEGSYVLRVDCFRQGAQVHYSYHKTKLFVQR